MTDDTQTIEARLRRFVYFEPRTLAFWRNLAIIYTLASFVGHWLEIPYCMIMDSLFGIVEDTYAVWFDPIYYPYWIYGVGCVVVTLAMEPLVALVIKRGRSTAISVVEAFLATVVVCMCLELVLGFLVNSPDEFGVYPYWDNSELPLNIFGQAWLVNDIVIGLVATLYLWVLYPLITGALRRMGDANANKVFVGCAVVLACAYTVYAVTVFFA